METTTAKSSVNKCPNCGGELTYSAATYSNKCEYCGSEFKVQAATDQGDESLIKDVSIIPFKINRDQFKKEMLRWIITGDFIPGNILSASRFSAIKQCYIPVYSFKGTCTGQWTGAKRQLGKPSPFQKKATETGSVNEPFSLLTLATDNLNGDVSSQFFQINIVNILNQFGNQGNNNDENGPLQLLVRTFEIKDQEVEPADARIFNDYNTLNFDLSTDEAWEKHGQTLIARRISNKLAEQSKKSMDWEVNLNVDYKMETVTKFYLPVWMTSYSYGTQEYKICTNGFNGKIYGQKVVDFKLQAPNKTKIYIASLLACFAISFCLFIASNATDITAHHNNLLFSPMWQGWWACRFLLLWIVIPIVASKLIHKKWDDMVRQSLIARREGELAAINSGHLKLNTN